MKDNVKIVIQIDNVTSQLHCAPVSLTRMISEELAFASPNYWFSPSFKAGTWDGKVRFFQRPSNKFPTGLLPIVAGIIEENGYEYTVVDKRTNTQLTIPTIPEEYQATPEKTLREYQVKTINILANSKCVGVPFLRGVINLATNAGKTTVASVVIKELYQQIQKINGNFLFLTHSKEIARQAQLSLEKDLGETIGFIGDGEWNLRTVSVALIPTLHRRLKTQEFKNLVKTTVGYVADEVHHSTATTWYMVLGKLINASIRLGLTGTVDKKNAINEYRLYASTGTIINKVSNQYLIDKGYSAVPDCILFNINDIELEDADYASAYELGIVKDESRLELIKLIGEKETAKNNKVLILIEHIAHGELIVEKLRSLNKVVEFTNGQLSSEERQEKLKNLANGKIDILISTAILDEGVDVSNINAIIYARGMKSSRKLLQGIGRGLRKKEDGSKLRFYDFIDNTNSNLLQHSLERYKTLKAEGFAIKRLEMEEYIKLEL